MTHNNYHIREGRREDIPQILSLIKELAEYEKSLHEITLTEAQMQEDGFGENPLFGVFVAEAENKVVGIALYFYRYSTWKGKTLYLEDLYVQEAYRKQQIGYQLLKAICKKAKEEKCKRLFWQVLDWNQPAIDFYKSLGAEFSTEWVNVFLTEEAFLKIK